MAFVYVSRTVFKTSSRHVDLDGSRTDARWRCCLPLRVCAIPVGAFIFRLASSFVSLHVVPAGAHLLFSSLLVVGKRE